MFPLSSIVDENLHDFMEREAVGAACECVWKTVSPLGPNEEIGQEDLWAGRFAVQQETIFFLLGKDHPWVFNTKPWQDVADFSDHLSLSVTFLSSSH